MPLEPLFYTASFIGIYFSIFLLVTLFENRGNLSRAPLTKNFPPVTVVIPCYNEEDAIEPTLKSLLSVNYPQHKLKVIIVDDGSTDNTYRKSLNLAQQFPHQIKVLRKENGGKYTALNYGLRQTDTELVGTLDADCFVHPEAFKRITAYFSDPQTQAVTSSVKAHSPKTIWQYFQNVLYLFVLLLRKVFSYFGSVKVTPGPLSVFRKEVFEEVGYYRKGHQTEDIELGLRLQKNDCQVKHALDAYVYTVTPPSFKGLYKQRVRWAYGGIRNFWDYRHLLGPRHGNLGILVLPANLLAIAIFPISALIILYRISHYLVIHIRNWSAVGFEWNALSSLLPSWTFSLPHPLIMLGICQALLTLIFILCSKKITRDQSRVGRSLLLAVVFSFPLFTLWLFGAFYRIILNQSVRW